MLLPLLVAVGASVAAANFREKIEELSAELVKGLSAGQALRIAVADLPDLRGTTNDFGRFVAERLSTRLAQAGRFNVIERRRLSQVLGELKFGMSDLVDPPRRAAWARCLASKRSSSARSPIWAIRSMSTSA
jgi:curli biogenesis system outer membrane secretion channel CsgG